MDLKTKILTSLVIWTITFFISGVYYLCIANQWDHKWDNAVLYKGEVHTDSSCSTSCNSEGKSCHTTCTNKYYVEQIFWKYIGSKSSCTVRRLTPYYHKGDANNFVSSMVLGTERTLYQTTYSAGTCFDEKIRYQWNVYGGVFISLSAIPVLIGLSILSYLLLKEKVLPWLQSIELPTFTLPDIKKNHERKSKFKFNEEGAVVSSSLDIV